MASPSTSQRQNRDTVEFPLNVPVTVSLRYSEGKLVSGQYGERYMFSTVDNRVFFVDPPVVEQIVKLGINVRESFTITRKASSTKGAPPSWEVARPIGEQPDGTLVIPPAPKPTQRAGSTSPLVDETNALVDAFAQVLERSLATYQGRVKPEEVRALLVTAYIQRAKFASAA